MRDIQQLFATIFFAFEPKHSANDLVSLKTKNTEYTEKRKETRVFAVFD